MAAGARPGDEVSLLPAIDIHTHYVPQPFVELLRANPGWNYAVEPAANGNSSITLASYLRPEPVLVKPEHREAAVRKDRMHDTGVDYQVLSAPTYLFGYHLRGSAAAEFAAAFNDCLSGAVAQEPDRFLGLAILPATDTDAAIAEWRRVKDRPGIVGVALGTRIGSSELSTRRRSSRSCAPSRPMTASYLFIRITYPNPADSRTSTSPIASGCRPRPRSADCG